MRARYSSFALLISCGLLAAPGRGDSGVTGVVTSAQAPAPAVALPNKDGSLKFAVLGDFGTGDRT